MKLLQINQKNLPLIAEKIKSPTYNRGQIKTGIVHIGVGGFHRAHQAYYIQQLLEKMGVVEWGICGVGIREADRKMYEVLRKQEGLYTLLVRHPDGKITTTIIGALTDMLLGVAQPEKVIDKMAHRDTKIVSLTITEGGYNFNSSTGAFNFENPVVQHDLAHPAKPQSVFGFLTAALRKRRAQHLPPFTILSCDNIQHNGKVARQMLLTFAKKQDADLADWIEEQVSFPNTMVDRITPVTSTADKEYLKNTYQINDEWPVTCEPFIQWVIEDDFSNGRPPLEKVGVQFVPDVTPYEKMKIRLLNAGHSVLGIPGAIHGHPTINACMEDVVFAKFMRQFMDKEATPVLDRVEGIDLTAYKDSIEQRFANPNIKDSVSRICSESSTKLPKFLIPTIQENLATGGSIEYGTLVLVAWCYYSDKGVNKHQQPLEIIDEMKNELHQTARETDQDPLAFLKQKEIFGDLVENERFTKCYREFVQKVYEGVEVRGLMKGMI